MTSWSWVWKLPDKAQLLLRQGCRRAERSSLINEPEAEVFGPALLERPFDFYGRPSPWQNSSAGDPISTCTARILSHRRAAKSLQGLPQRLHHPTDLRMRLVTLIQIG